MARTPMLNEDVYRLICHEYAQGHDSLLNLACASRLFAAICRGHLFRHMKLDIHCGQDSEELGAILERDPALSSAVWQVTLFDGGMPPLPQLSNIEPEEHTPSPTTDQYTLLTNDSSHFSFIIPRLSNLKAVELYLKYTFANTPPLRWEELSTAFQQLLLRPEVRNVGLEGIHNIPMDVSTMFLSKDSLRLSRCTYTPPVVDLSRWPASNFKVTVTKLALEWIGLEEASDIREETTTIIHHWVYAHVIHGIPFPSIDSLHLALGCWASISEAGEFLRLFQNSIRSLSLNTTKLHLEALQILPFNLPARKGQLIPKAVSAFSVAHIPTLIVQGIPAYQDGWAAFELEPISLRANLDPAVRALSYRVKQWAADPTKRGNGELAWVVNMLQVLPAPRARALQSLSLVVEVGGHMHMAASVCDLLATLAGEMVWNELRTTLSREEFSALREVEITLVLPCRLTGALAQMLCTVTGYIQRCLLWSFPRRGLQVSVVGA
ncbi:hypothetical protein HYPSUDRAFT_200026 [Hypholoma sublateritium FD-334 SS-4]|uniref:Uncharacterized protein n=1 Tax=Hypholoma sublateritium (strain FD-334 SS-4) TaxID=945553 RepID=A0A0D2MMF6_HYPSF|nr:hypothetical protein HYPSUDRAFT_200026 [Hypholoma sublateritium FD-334 SS-4]